MTRETWSPSEVQFLRDNHATMSRQAIADVLGTHSERAVRDKLRTLGLTDTRSASERMAAMNERGDGNVGDEFDMLTVIGEKVLVQQGKDRCYQVLCRCVCGTERPFLLTNLRRGRATSCGCKAAKAAGDRNRTHGMSKTRLYSVWAGMKQRCLNQNHESYHDYGAKGVRVCDEWMSFEPFRDWALSNGYNDELEVDRIDCMGDYSPTNCRFGDEIVQANNRTNNRRETVWGETKTVAEWSRDARCAVSHEVLQDRIQKLGWSMELAMTTPKLRTSE